MAKAKWGKKRTCPSCGAPFYDLKRKHPVCPKCDTPLAEPSAAKPKRAQPEETAAVTEEPATPPAETVADAVVEKTGKDVVDEGDEAVIGEVDEVDDDNDDDDELIEDASDLGEDDDDMSEVKEHIDPEVEDKS